MKHDARVRFGILGTSGRASRVAAPVLKASAEVTLLGAAGSAPERGAQFAQQHGLPHSDRSVEEMLDDRDIDAVWICSPNHLHARQIAQCAAAGKHVLVEKPLATTREDAERAGRGAGEAGITLRVGCQHRFRPSRRHIRELIASGFVGKLGYFRIHRFWRYPYFEDMDPSGPPQWRRSADESGGWVIKDVGSQLLRSAAVDVGSQGHARGRGAGGATVRFADRRQHRGAAAPWRKRDRHHGNKLRQREPRKPHRGVWQQRLDPRRRYVVGRRHRHYARGPHSLISSGPDAGHLWCRGCRFRRRAAWRTWIGADAAAGTALAEIIETAVCA